MGAVAGLIIRLGCSVAAYFLVVLLVQLFVSVSWINLLAWPFFAVYSLMLFGWYGVLLLPLGAYLADALLRQLPWLSERKFRLQSALIAGDLLAGAAISRIAYAGNDFFFLCGCAATVLFTVLFRMIERLPYYRNDRSLAE